MGVYRVDTGYVDEAGLIVAQGEHVELSAGDAELGLAAGFLALVDDLADPAGLLADDPEPPKPKRRSR